MRYLQTGLTERDDSRAAAGFTLFAPQYQRKVYLVNMAGDVVHDWDLPDRPGNYAYMLPNGNLFRSYWAGGGPDGLSAKGGVMQEVSWSGEILWEYRDEFQHHDFRRCPNGNLMYLGWALLSKADEARVVGGTPGSEHSAGGIWGDYIREVNSDGETVWQWNGWEHMEIEKYPLHFNSNRHEMAHPNTLVPLENGDAMICFRHIDVVAIVDRATGKFSYERHEPDWGGPHDFHRLDNGNFMVFANRGGQRPRGSKIVEWDPKTEETVWEYWGNPTHTFDSHFISGCQRLWNGNTLICEGLWGRFFEVTPCGDVVWEYINPFTHHVDRGPTVGDQSVVFRAFRYAPDGPEIQGRLDGKLG